MGPLAGASVGRAADGVDSMGAPADASTQSESPSAPSALSARQAEMLRLYDTNHDGRLDDQELAAAHAQMLEHQIATGGEPARRLYASMLQRFDKEHKGSLTPEEQAAAVTFVQQHNKEAFNRMLQRFDRNGDGTLDASETAAMFTVFANLAARSRSPASLGAASGMGVTTTTTTTTASGNARGPAFAAQVYSRLLARFDANHDGRLEPAEQVAALKALQANNPRIYQRMLERFDRDGDGTLDAAESQALFSALAALPSVAVSAERK